MAGAALTSPGRAARYTEMPQPRSVPLAGHRGKSRTAELPRPPPEQVEAFSAAPRAPPAMLRSRPNTAGRLSAPSPTNSGPATRVRPSACAGSQRREGAGPPRVLPKFCARPPRRSSRGRGRARRGRRAPAGRCPDAAPRISPPFPTLKHVHFGARASCSPAGDTAHPSGGTGPALTARRSAPPAPIELGGRPAAALPLRKATSV